MLEERDARIAVLEAALEPFVRAWCLVADQPNLTQRLTLAQLSELACHELSGADFQRARRAAAYPTHSEGGEADTGCDDDKLPGTADDWRNALRRAIAKRHRDNHDTSPPCAAEPDLELSDVKDALETLGDS